MLVGPDGLKSGGASALLLVNQVFEILHCKDFGVADLGWEPAIPVYAIRPPKENEACVC